MNEIENTLKQIIESIEKGFRISNVNPNFVKPATSKSKDQAVLIMLERKFHISFTGMEDEGHPADSLLEKCLTKYTNKIQKDYRSSVYLRGVVDEARIIALHDQLEPIQTAAKLYLCEIDDELAKDKTSALRIDHSLTDEDNSPCITLASLDQWAREKFDIDINNPLPSQADIENHKSPQKENDPLKGGLRKTKATNLQITFALLVEDFAKTAPKYHINEDKPNVSAIAKHLEKLAKEDNRGLSGQSSETIKSCIEAAIKIKNNPPI